MADRNAPQGHGLRGSIKTVSAPRLKPPGHSSPAIHPRFPAGVPNICTAYLAKILVQLVQTLSIFYFADHGFAVHNRIEAAILSLRADEALD